MTATCKSLASEITAKGLREAGRSPATPFIVALEDRRTVTVERLLRVLPGRRIVGEGRLESMHVLVKLFIDRDSTRHWRREHDGIAALVHAGIPTPEPVQSGPLDGGGHALLTRFLPDARTLAESWKAVADLPAGDPRAKRVLVGALRVLGRMHARGLVHLDLHLGNFLSHGESLLVLDGDAVRGPKQGDTLSRGEATENLALLLAQLPARWDTHLDELLSAYAAEGTSTDLEALLDAIAHTRSLRLRRFLDKTVRDCTEFAVAQDSTRFTAVVRNAADWLTPLVAAPDAALKSGSTLKAGRTATVSHVNHAGHDLVIKRYNLKNLGHALSRLCRPSRAWHSWREAHRLALLGIATPRPLALIEERIGPLRRRAWLITEHCPGRNLLRELDPNKPPPTAHGETLLRLLRSLQRERISHGDLKATNLLWHDGRIVLLDLDAVIAHRSDTAFTRAWQRDRARLLRNWPEGSALHAWLAEYLPPA